MQKTPYYLAVDIGASSGRHLAGRWIDDVLTTEEIYRFPNGVTEQNGHLTWDIDALEHHVLEGLRRSIELYGPPESVAIDTWGVDYVLLENDRPILPVYAYRDGRTEEAIKQVHTQIPFEALYETTGIQFQPFNTIYQLFDDLGAGRLTRADEFLMIPEYLTFRLCGVKYHEYTNATTTGLLNAATGEYDVNLLDRLGLPRRLFGRLTPPGTVLGPLREEVASRVGGQTMVVACASHDTASAVEGIPIEGDAPYISSGTWSLLGLRAPHALTDAASCRANYSNEGGVGYIRYQKNIMGMWVVNRLRDELAPERSFSELTAMAHASSYEEDRFVDVNDERFLSPDSMVAAFDSFFEKGKGPRAIGDYFKCATISLAHSYGQALKELSENTGRTFDTLYIVGGGAKNTYLNEMTEKVCHIRVVALPIEATALGNLKLQRGATHE